MSPRAALSTFAAVSLVAIPFLACQPDKTVQPRGENHPPRARLSLPATALEGTQLTISTEGSSDPDEETLSFHLDFGDGQAVVTSERRIAHAYRDDGPYTARVIARDARGAADTAFATIQVVNVAPQISLVRVPEYAVGGGIPTHVEVQYSDPGLDDTLRATIAFSLSGSTVREAALVRPGITTQTLPDPGSYVVRVTVQDDDGASVQSAAARTLDIVGRYELIDLGTLGGHSASPVALNDSGHVVGCSLTAGGQSHAFVWRNGTMADLSPGMEHSCAHTITNSGVMGGYQQRVHDSLHVVKWDRNGAVTSLGACCESGLTVVALTSSDLVSVGWTVHNYRSVIWQDGLRQDLGSLGPSGYSAAKAMNHRRQIVGFSRMGPADESASIHHAFIWENGVMRDLGVLGPPCDDPSTNCASTYAIDINNAAVVIGTNHDSRGPRGVRWINGRIEELGFADPRAINSAGDIAGNGAYGTPSFGNAYFWRGGVLRTLGSVGGGTFVVDMNDQSTVLASSFSSDRVPHVVLWSASDGRLVDLGVGSLSGGGLGAFAIAMNARGDIIGKRVGPCASEDPGASWYCTDWSGPSRAILWRKKA